ncbi:MAG: PD-(D/E)XK nuclease family protein [Lachnospiraceae bacterium]|nr:PD-(D/E)XK nuclease family protein [Lachnospiraceae bacterium]
MGLQIIAGASGSGKSTYAYEQIIKKSMEEPGRQFIVIVPDQFSMSTTRQILRLHPRGAISNIDVLSFSRLVHRIGDEVGMKKRQVLDDTGKNLILRRVALSLGDSLTVLQGKMKRPGYIHEVKSQISEFYQYDISADVLSDLLKEDTGHGYLAGKLSDLKILYEAFGEYIRDKYITTEEALSELSDMIPKSGLLSDATILFDNFTGFTPIQYRVIRELMKVCRDLSVILCCEHDPEEEKDRLFELSKKTYQKLTAVAGEADCPVLPVICLTNSGHFRYEGNPPMAFLEKELLRYRKEVYAGPQDAITVYEAVSRREEVQNCCRQIAKLIREGYEYRSIAIETGDPDGYEMLLKTELERYGIPFYMDSRRSVLHNQAVSMLRCVLRIFAEDFSYDSVIGLLHSRMTDFSLEEIDRLDVYLQRMGIKGKTAFSRPFERGEQAEEMNLLRERLMELLAPFLKKPETAKEYVAALYEVCLGSRLCEKCYDLAERFLAMQDPYRAKEYEKIYEAIMELLDQIDGLIGEDRLDEKEFLALFEAGVSEIRIGTIPQSVDQVMVGDIQRTRLENIKALFFLGINEGIIPQKNAGGGLFSDREREYLQSKGLTLSPGAKEKLFEQRLYLYQNMTKPEEKLFLSYALLGSDGKSMSPSYLIRNLLFLYPHLQVEGAKNENEKLQGIASMEDGLEDMADLLRIFASGRQSGQNREETKASLQVLSAAYRDNKEAFLLKNSAFYRYIPARISREAALCIYDREGTISRLEKMAACPFSHFLRYGLGLREKEEYSFEATDLGNMYHKVLERLLRSLRDEEMPAWEADPEELAKRISDILEEEAASYGYDILISSARNRFRTRQMKQVLTDCVGELSYRLGKGAFVPYRFEYYFKDEQQTRLKGIIDRIDVAEQGDTFYVKVVDYKTGEQTFDLSKLYYGFSLQLPIYLEMARRMVEQAGPNKNAVAAAMLYSTVKSPLIIGDDPKDIEKKIRAQMRPNGLFLEDEEILRMLDSRFPETGKSDILYLARKKDGSFYNYSQTASKQLMEGCIRHAFLVASRLSEQIMEGDISIRPKVLEKDKFDSCMYCSYKGICGFDERIPGFEKTSCKAAGEEVFLARGEEEQKQSEDER